MKLCTYFPPAHIQPGTRAGFLPDMFPAFSSEGGIAASFELRVWTRQILNQVASEQAGHTQHTSADCLAIAVRLLVWLHLWSSSCSESAQSMHLRATPQAGVAQLHQCLRSQQESSLFPRSDSSNGSKRQSLKQKQFRVVASLSILTTLVQSQQQGKLLQPSSLKCS